MSLYDQLPDKSYIKKLLIGIDADFTERFLSMKVKYEKTKDKEEKRMFRDQLTNLYWELFRMIAITITPELSLAKRLFLRYGLTDLRHLSPEDQKFVLNQNNQPINYDSETIFYADEWLQGIALGKIKASAGDETQAAPKNSPAQLGGKQEKYVALIEVEQRRLTDFQNQREQILTEIQKILTQLKEVHVEEETGYEGVFTAEQNKAVDNIVYYHKELKKVSKEIFNCAKTMRKSQNSLDEIKAEEGEIAVAASNPMVETLTSEVANIRQMAKMTVGRQGNPFPMLTSSFMPKETREYLFRETVRKKLNKWLEIDPEAFVRTYKGEDMNIMPYMILLPGYGVTGACWEPLDNNNKQFGRGRVILPIFTRSPDLSLLTAVGDIRWQAAKEIASYYWMEEGLTGRYYEYYLGAKLKGDLRTLFITDYLLWMTKETQGIQKLEQDARYVFWRYVPLPDEQKIKLSQKGYYYNQLWEKEQVWKKQKK